MAAQVRLAQPVEYYRKFLEQNVRPDGRELGEIRATTLNIGSITTAEGSAMVKLGDTTVVCGIKAELTTPKSEAQKCGFIVPNVDLPPLCSPKFKPGPPMEAAQVASKFMDNVIINSKCVDVQKLCIEEGKLVWVLYCDLICLDHAGNLLDACTIALLSALKNVSLPTVTMNEETGLPEADFTQKVPLHVSTQPVSTTFAIFDDEVIFVDPTMEEEDLSTGSITIVTLQDGQIAMVHKPGGSCVTEVQLQNCISRARAHTAEVCELIDGTINALDR